MGMAALATELTLVPQFCCGVAALGIVGSVAWLGVPIVWMVARRTMPRMTTPQRVGTALGLVVLLGVTFTPGWHQCAHADTVFFAAFGISYSAQGGPCRNAPHRGGVHIAGNWYLAFRK